ncbi:alpha/beta hydrolase family protein [Streptosporangium sp. CA-135522]|uniref:alpha/beta hydrolase family protein n=1 Tax=Streptosporangium sp. CA-135522 TaxID=3240072 RepID=UPI003D93D25F
MQKTILRGALAAAVALFAFTPPAATAAAGASAAVPASPSPTASTAAAGPVVLSRPTGPHPVGMTSLHLVDDSRPDPWVAEEKSRELMVSLWYPARASHGRRAPYMTSQESTLLLKGIGLDDVPPDTLSRTRTNAVVDAAPLGRRHGLPLVVLSPGFSLPRSSLTALAEDLASRGYVVAGIDHTHEASGTTFPDGHTATCVACESESTLEFGAKVTKGRAADVSFVLDRLTGPHPAWKDAEVIDPSRIAMGGHSVGGSGSQRTMIEDSRVRAGVNLDGTFFVPIPDDGLSRPFLMMGAGKANQSGGADPTWSRDWNHMTGWKRWLMVDGMTHGSFTDYPLAAEQLGLNFGEPLGGARSVEITRKYVGAFFDLHLRKRSQPLLERPSRRYPEVKFEG